MESIAIPNTTSNDGSPQQNDQVLNSSALSQSGVTGEGETNPLAAENAATKGSGGPLKSFTALLAVAQGKNVMTKIASKAKLQVYEKKRLTREEKLKQRLAIAHRKRQLAMKAKAAFNQGIQNLNDGEDRDRSGENGEDGYSSSSSHRSRSSGKLQPVLNPDSVIRTFGNISSSHSGFLALQDERQAARSPFLTSSPSLRPLEPALQGAAASGRYKRPWENGNSGKAPVPTVMEDSLEEEALPPPPRMSLDERLEAKRREVEALRRKVEMEAQRMAEEKAAKEAKERAEKEEAEQARLQEKEEARRKAREEATDILSKLTMGAAPSSHHSVQFAVKDSPAQSPSQGEGLISKEGEGTDSSPSSRKPSIRRKKSSDLGTNGRRKSKDSSGASLNRRRSSAHSTTIVVSESMHPSSSRRGSRVAQSSDQSDSEGGLPLQSPPSKHGSGKKLKKNGSTVGSGSGSKGKNTVKKKKTNQKLSPTTKDPQKHTVDDDGGCLSLGATYTSVMSLGDDPGSPSLSPKQPSSGNHWPAEGKGGDGVTLPVPPPAAATRGVATPSRTELTDPLPLTLSKADDREPSRATLHQHLKEAISAESKRRVINELLSEQASQAQDGSGETSLNGSPLGGGSSQPTMEVAGGQDGSSTGSRGGSNIQTGVMYPEGAPSDGRESAGEGKNGKLGGPRRSTENEEREKLEAARRRKEKAAEASAKRLAEIDAQEIERRIRKAETRKEKARSESQKRGMQQEKKNYCRNLVAQCSSESAKLQADMTQRNRGKKALLDAIQKAERIWKALNKVKLKATRTTSINGVGGASLAADATNDEEDTPATKPKVPQLFSAEAERAERKLAEYEKFLQATLFTAYRPSSFPDPDQTATAERMKGFQGLSTKERLSLFRSELESQIKQLQTESEKRFVLLKLIRTEVAVASTENPSTEDDGNISSLSYLENLSARLNSHEEQFPGFVVLCPMLELGNLDQICTTVHDRFIKEKEDIEYRERLEKQQQQISGKGFPAEGNASMTFGSDLPPSVSVTGGNGLTNLCRSHGRREEEKLPLLVKLQGMLEGKFDHRKLIESTLSRQLNGEHHPPPVRAKRTGNESARDIVKHELAEAAKVSILLKSAQEGGEGVGGAATARTWNEATGRKRNKVATFLPSLHAVTQTAIEAAAANPASFRREMERIVRQTLSIVPSPPSNPNSGHDQFSAAETKKRFLSSHEVQQGTMMIKHPPATSSGSTSSPLTLEVPGVPISSEMSIALPTVDSDKSLMTSHFSQSTSRLQEGSGPFFPSPPQQRPRAATQVAADPALFRQFFGVGGPSFGPGVSPLHSTRTSH